MLIDAREVTSLGDNPYWVFISFLFAWVVANIGERLSNINSHWKEHRPRVRKRWYLPVYSHLTLAAFVVATSWLGWTESFTYKCGNVVIISSDPRFARVISPLSLLLIVDFWILALYFAFVGAVNGARLADKPTYFTPASDHAAYWLFWIFVGYIVWDFLVYNLLPRMTGDGDADQFWARSWMSILCAVLALGAFFWLRRVLPSSRYAILVSDLALIALVLVYRGLKQFATASQNPITQIEGLGVHPFRSVTAGFTSVCLILFVTFSLLYKLAFNRR